MGKQIDLSGQHFKYFDVVKRKIKKYDKYNVIGWSCVCSCGKEFLPQLQT